MKHKVLSVKEDIFTALITLCAGCSIGIVLLVAAYMLWAGLPALWGLNSGSLFGAEWSPQENKYGLTAMALASLAASFGAVALALPFALAAAAFKTNMAPPLSAAIITELSKLMSGLPSVVLGLLGLTQLLPAIAVVFPTETAQNGGATLLASIIILGITVLPSLLLALSQAMEEIPSTLLQASDALGAHRTETVCFVLIPAVFHRMIGVASTGIGRALGEAMVVLLVSGNVARMPKLFASVRLLASGMVLEMGYATGVHRQALFSAGLLLMAMTLFVTLIFGSIGSGRK